MAKGISPIVFIVIVVVIAVVSIYFATQKPQNISDNSGNPGGQLGQSSGPKCPDGVCDEFEKSSGACPQDCGGSGTVPGQQTPSSSQSQTIDESAPVPVPPVLGENKTLKLGDIKITYYSVAASYPTISLGADLLMRVKNTGASAETFNVKQSGTVPTWNRHFFVFHPENITLQPNEEKVLHYFASMDDKGEFNMNFDFWQVPDMSDKVTASVKFYGGSSDERLKNTALVYGYVRDKATGKGISGAPVKINLYNGRESYYQQTDSQGMYSVAVPGVDDIRSFFGGQELYYSSLNYFVTVDASGYEYYYHDGIAPKRGERLGVDMSLDAAGAKPTYTMKWEQKVSDYYGFFYAFADDAWKYIAAAQAKHEPSLDKATNFYLFDASTGEVKWKYPTGNECWGFDISRDGSMVSAGCNDNYVYVIGSDGTLKWKKDSGATNREVEFSHDGKYLVTGPMSNYDSVLMKTSDGTILQGFSDAKQWLRNSKFTNDDSKFVTGYSFGYISMHSTDGKILWTNYVGEFPLFLAVDNKDNTYASGKGRTLFAFDSSGNEKWHYRVPDHVVTSGAISDDGSRIAIGTIGAWVYYIDGADGNVLWRQKIGGENVGHNAVSISKDGKYVAIGGAPEYIIYVFNEHGTKIFSYKSQENIDPILNEKWAGIGKDASEGTQRGVMGTYISADGSKIVAAYGDDYVREFVRQ